MVMNISFRGPGEFNQELFSLQHCLFERTQDLSGKMFIYIEYKLYKIFSEFELYIKLNFKIVCTNSEKNSIIKPKIFFKLVENNKIKQKIMNSIKPFVISKFG